MFKDGTCAGGWFWIRSRNCSLMTTVNCVVNDCRHLNFHCFYTWDGSCEHSPGCTRTDVHTWDCSCNILRDVLVLLNVTDVHQCSKNKRSLPFVFVCLLYDLLSFFLHCRLFIWNQTLLGMKDLLFILFGFPRHDSSEPYVTLDSWSSLIRTTFGLHTSFFPGSHLRVSRTPWILRFTWRILSHRYAVPRDETTCASFHLQRKLSEELSWDLFIGSTSCAKL